VTAEVLEGTIIAPRFFYLARRLPGLRALDRVQVTGGTALGVGLVMGESKKILPLTLEDEREAFEQ